MVASGSSRCWFVVCIGSGDGVVSMSDKQLQIVLLALFLVGGIAWAMLLIGGA